MVSEDSSLLSLVSSLLSLVSSLLSLVSSLLSLVSCFSLPPSLPSALGSPCDACDPKDLSDVAAGELEREAESESECDLLPFTH